MSRRFLAAALVLVGISVAIEANALKFVPFVQEFTPRGPGAKRVFRVENDGPAEVAVQITMAHRQMALDGSETLSDAEDDFIVFPPQLVLKPGESRAVRVQWIGDPAPKTELPYRIIAEQLPVDFSGSTAAGSVVRLLIRYEGSIYIVPPGAASDVAVVSASAERAADGSQKLVVTVENKGTAHALLRELSLKVASTADSTTTTVPPERLDGFRGENVLAGHQRRFVVPWPDGVTFGPVTVAMSFAGPR